MDNTCDTCFYTSFSAKEFPCNGCTTSEGHPDNRWVSMNVFDSVDDTQGSKAMKEMVTSLTAEAANDSALNKQISGSHYKGLKIQPIEYLHANNIPFAEGCAIKYLTRWRDKGGISDLEKAKHFIELLIELETKTIG